MDPELFVDQSSIEDFTCQICWHVVEDPIVEHMDCTKLFCKSCFEGLCKAECPNCRQSTAGRVRGMNPLVREKIYFKIEMKCPYNGCTEIFPLSRKGQHEAECPFRGIECSYCSLRVSPEKLDEHCHTDCQLYPIICYVPGCGCQTTRSQQDQHDKENYQQHNILFMTHINELESKLKSAMTGIAVENLSLSITPIAAKFIATNETLQQAVNDWCSNPQLATETYGDISTWDTSNVTTMKDLFHNKTQFNDDITQWNVSRVTNMSNMFCNASSFNQRLDSWNVSNVTDMSYMFYMAVRFNQPLHSWQVHNVTNMSSLFGQAIRFNQPLDAWNVSSVRDITHMFSVASQFNQCINSWQVNNVTSMSGMFHHASAFNQPLHSWRVDNVTSMSNMFYNATAFNQCLDGWVTSNVTNMKGMFYCAISFNQPLNSWNVQRVRDMSYMFYRASVFNQPLNQWCIVAVTNMRSMFQDAVSFNQELNSWDEYVTTKHGVLDLTDVFTGASRFTHRLLALQKKWKFLK